MVLIVAVASLSFAESGKELLAGPACNVNVGLMEGGFGARRNLF
jgi:hypothetical protein